MLKGLVVSQGILSELTKEMDVIIILGGDDFTEDYGWKALVSMLLKINPVARAKKLYFLGQTMGPFKSFRVHLCRYFFNKAKGIFCRDDITYNYLKELNVKNISKIPDLALMPLAKENNVNNLQEQICIFPSELIFHYTEKKSRAKCLSFYIKICNEINKKYPDKKLLLIPHVLKPDSSDDRKMVKDIYLKLKDSMKDKLLMYDNEMYPYQVREEIKKSSFIVTARMHPYISSIECNIPGVCFSYSRKYWGIIGEGYNLKDCIIDIRQGSEKDWVQGFLLALDKLMENKDKILKDTKIENKKDQDLILVELKKLGNSIMQGE